MNAHTVDNIQGAGGEVVEIPAAKDSRMHWVLT